MTPEPSGHYDCRDRAADVALPTTSWGPTGDRHPPRRSSTAFARVRGPASEESAVHDRAGERTESDLMVLGHAAGAVPAVRRCRHGATGGIQTSARPSDDRLVCILCDDAPRPAHRCDSNLWGSYSGDDGGFSPGRRRRLSVLVPVPDSLPRPMLSCRNLRCGARVRRRHSPTYADGPWREPEAGLLWVPVRKPHERSALRRALAGARHVRRLSYHPELGRALPLPAEQMAFDANGLETRPAGTSVR